VLRAPLFCWMRVQQAEEGDGGDARWMRGEDGWSVEKSVRAGSRKEGTGLGGLRTALFEREEATKRKRKQNQRHQCACTTVAWVLVRDGMRRVVASRLRLLSVRGGGGAEAQSQSTTGGPHRSIREQKHAGMRFIRSMTPPHLRCPLRLAVLPVAGGAEWLAVRLSLPLLRRSAALALTGGRVEPPTCSPWPT
jgi:hypothetical protein